MSDMLVMFFSRVVTYFCDTFVHSMVHRPQKHRTASRPASLPNAVHEEMGNRSVSSGGVFGAKGRVNYAEMMSNVGCMVAIYIYIR